MNEDWITLQVFVRDEMADAVSNFCHEEHSGGVLLERIEPATTRVTAYFATDRWPEVAPRLESYLTSLRSIYPHLPRPRVATTRLKRENWAICWRDRFKPIRIGTRLIVTPPWIKPERQGREVVIIEPGEAFGTGTHETTRGCLVLLEQAVAELGPQLEELTLLDLGCGSGILAIAGRRLGAKTVEAIDNDPRAIESAMRNAELNGMKDEIRFECQAVEETTGAWHIVTANLDPLTLARNQKRVISLCSRFLIVSGIPLNQWQDVKQGLLDSHMRLESDISGPEWGCALFSH